MAKSNKALYKAYIRSNKVRRSSIVKNNGFKTEKSYLLSLGVEKPIRKRVRVK